MKQPKTIAITGGAQGIGRAIALFYARKGWQVSIADIHQQAGEETLALIEKEMGAALYVPTDISQASQVNAWLNKTVSTFGCPDVLINNAAIGINKNFVDLSLNEFKYVQAVNVDGTFVCSQAIAKLMIQHRVEGCIINLASTRAFMSEANTEAYSASKGAVLSLTHAMAVSLGKHHIRVNSISPGWIETGAFQFSKENIMSNHSEEDKLQHLVGRVGEPMDIAKACLFLSEHADFMTGQNIVIDGGMSVKMIYV